MVGGQLPRAFPASYHHHNCHDHQSHDDHHDHDEHQGHDDDQGHDGHHSHADDDDDKGQYDQCDNFHDFTILMQSDSDNNGVDDDGTRLPHCNGRQTNT